MANIKHTVAVGLKDKGGSTYEGAVIEIVLPEEHGVTDAHVQQHLIANAKVLGYKIDSSVAQLGDANLAQIEYGGIEWVVQNSEAI